jgi:hypothetical protein
MKEEKDFTSSKKFTTPQKLSENKLNDLIELVDTRVKDYKPAEDANANS